MQDHEDGTVDRRRLLRRAGTVAAGVAGAGVVSAVAASPASAAAGDAVLQGQTNTVGSATTTVTTNSLANPTLTLSNPAKDGSGYTAAPLRLVPNAGTFGLSPNAPVGSVALDGEGVIWFNSISIGGVDYVESVLDTYTGNVTVPLLVPTRIVDTRSAAGRTNILNTSALDSSGRVKGGQILNITLDDAVFAAEGVFINLTAVTPTKAGYLTSFPYGTARPGTSNLNYGTGTLSNFAIAGLSYVNESSSALLSVYAHTTTHVIVDALAFIVAYRQQINPTLLGGAAVQGAQADDKAAQRRLAISKYVGRQD